MKDNPSPLEPVDCSQRTTSTYGYDMTDGIEEATVTATVTVVVAAS